MRRLAVILALLGLLAPACANAAGVHRGPEGGFTATENDRALIAAETPVPVPDSPVAPRGRRLSAEQVIAIANAVPRMRQLRREYPGSYEGAYLKGPLRWQVSYFTRRGAREIGQLYISDATGRVLEVWTGFQVAWTMARGYPGAFGEHVNDWFVWIPLCVLFLLPFASYRRPLSLMNLDLLALLSFSVSLAFFNHAHIYASVPLSYPPLLYLLARMLSMLRRRRAGRPPPGPLRLLLPARWLAVGVVFLLAFRIALNVTDGNVIDVGYAGVIGASRITEGRGIYGTFPADNEHGDTYGPVNYEAYVPFEQAFGWSGSWDDLPAAHAAAIFFDLLCVTLLFLIGRRMRGPTLGVALAYAWVSFPFTLYALESDSNDALVAALILGAVLAASHSSSLARGGRGALAALAGLSKFAPLALAPVLATHGLPAGRPARRRQLAIFAAGFLLAAVLAAVPLLGHASLAEIYRRTVEYQSTRDSPFSVWGLYGLHGLAPITELCAAALAVVLALVPRRSDIVGLAAACAAIVIAEQIALEHWFYLYIPWFFGLVMIALLGRFADAAAPTAGAASVSARSSRPAALAST